MSTLFPHASDIAVTVAIVLLFPFVVAGYKVLDRLAGALIDTYLPDPPLDCCCHAEAFNVLAARARISPRPRVENEQQYVDLLWRVADAASNILASEPTPSVWANDLGTAIDDLVAYEQRSEFTRSPGTAPPSV